MRRVRIGLLACLASSVAIFAAACGSGNDNAAIADSGAADQIVEDAIDETADEVTDAADAADARCFFIDDAGVTHGCSPGGDGPGDRDDGGGVAPPPPDASADASDLPFGAQCLRNDQCASDLCYFYRAKGQFCTQFCDPPPTCPAPSLGCNAQGVCREGN